MPLAYQPRLRFSEWVRWDKRLQLKRSDGPWLGVYLWGHFNEAPKKSVRPYPRLPREVIYVGDTKHLDVRPLTGEHHRLAHYRETFRDDPDLARLYLSICRVHHFPDGYTAPDAADLYARLRVYTQYLEARIYWMYTKRWNRRPALHYKKGA